MINRQTNTDNQTQTKAKTHLKQIDQKRQRNDRSKIGKLKQIDFLYTIKTDRKKTKTELT